MKVGTDGVLLGAWVNACNKARILDIGTGTGLIALMLAQRTSAQIYAVEIENDAYFQAKKNFELSKWKDRIYASNITVQEYAGLHNSGFDLIVCNPPFFSNSLKTPQMARNLARHNDRLLPNDLLTSANLLLTDSGRFAVIMPYVDAALFIVDAVLNNLFCTRKTLVRSSINKKPHRILMEFNRLRIKPVETELVIYNEDGSYTDEYKILTSDFYLAVC